MYVCHTNQIESRRANQISCCKGKWYVRRFDPDTVQNGHIYSSVKEEEVFIYWVYFDVFVLVACKYSEIILLFSYKR